MSNQRLGNPMDYVPPENSKPREPAGTAPTDLQRHADRGIESDVSPEKTETGAFLRKGDTGLGVPKSEVKATRILSEKETNKHHEEVEKEMRHQAEEMLMAFDSENSWRLPKIFRQVLTGIFIAVASILGVMIVTEAVQFAVSIQSLPEWARWLAISGFALFGGIIVAIILWLFWKAVRLQQSPQVNLKELKALAERQHMQLVAFAKQAEAKQLLENYLQNYPLTSEMRAKFFALGMVDQEWGELKTGHKRLLDTRRPMSPANWCEDFQRCFQSNLDELARRRTLQYARRVGFGTAASSVAVVDRMIVLYSSFALIKDLLTIYNLGPTLGQSIVTLAKAIVHTYLSGMLEEAAESAVDSLADSLSEFSESGIDIVTGTVGRAVSAKTAEATLNGFFLYRLGKKTTQLIQPIRSR